MTYALTWTSIETDTGEMYGLGCDKSLVIRERYELDCDNRGAIVALLEASGKPDSFINNHGPPDLNALQLEGLIGLLLPPLEDKTIQDLTDFDVQYYHMGHGNPQTVDANETAFPWRNAGFAHCKYHRRCGRSFVER